MPSVNLIIYKNKFVCINPNITEEHFTKINNIVISKLKQAYILQLIMKIRYDNGFNRQEMDLY